MMHRRRRRYPAPTLGPFGVHCDRYAARLRAVDRAIRRAGARATVELVTARTGLPRAQVVGALHRLRYRWTTGHHPLEQAP